MPVMAVQKSPVVEFMHVVGLWTHLPAFSFLSQIHVSQSGPSLRLGLCQEAAINQDVPVWFGGTGQVQTTAQGVPPVLCQYSDHPSLSAVPHAPQAGEVPAVL